jgi:hypothetical protein
MSFVLENQDKHFLQDRAELMNLPVDGTKAELLQRIKAKKGVKSPAKRGRKASPSTFLNSKSKQYLADRAEMMGLSTKGTKAELLKRIKRKSKSPAKKSKVSPKKSKSPAKKSKVSPKKSKSPAKKSRKLHVGPRGGKYYISKGKHVYV